MLGTELLDIAFALIFGCIFLAFVLRGYKPPRRAIVMLVAGWGVLGAGRFLALFIGLTSLQGSLVVWNLAATGGLALLLWGLLMTFGVADAEPKPATPKAAAPTGGAARPAARPVVRPPPRAPAASPGAPAEDADPSDEEPSA